MRLTPESIVSTMTREQLTRQLDLHDETKSVQELRDLLVMSERSRSLCMWHDHATILKTGYIMITVHVIYDTVAFFTNKEYEKMHPVYIANIQSEVEQPEIPLLAACSSRVEDQAALVGDRLSCLQDLAQPVRAENGMEITDTLQFFTGDHPATQFEQGTKPHTTPLEVVISATNPCYSRKIRGTTWITQTVWAQSETATDGIEPDQVPALLTTVAFSPNHSWLLDPRHPSGGWLDCTMIVYG